MHVRAATRGSALARWQTSHVGSLLEPHGVTVEPVIVSTGGDRDKTTPLSQIGGKGVFVKEVQAAVLDGRADIAVHSAKDLPAITPPGLLLAAIPERADARDALIGASLETLKPGARVGTGSARRRVQLLVARPDITCVELRGNIDTRLAKVGELDAIVMAAAALDRLGLAPEPIELLDAGLMVPQVGQGALAIECRSGDPEVQGALSSIEDSMTRRLVDAERAFLNELGGDCDLPAGAFATLDDEGQVTLRAILASADERTVERVILHGQDGRTLGYDAAVKLRALVGSM